MDLIPILLQIDIELEKLERIRTIVTELSGTNPRVSFSAPRRKQKKTTNQMSLELEPAATAVEPQIVILPPKSKREYTPRHKAHAETPNALSSAVPNKPVFVPKAVAAPPAKAVPTPKKETDLGALEAAIRQNLLGKNR